MFRQLDLKQIECKFRDTKETFSGKLLSTICTCLFVTVEKTVRGQVYFYGT